MTDLYALPPMGVASPRMNPIHEDIELDINSSFPTTQPITTANNNNNNSQNINAPVVPVPVPVPAPPEFNNSELLSCINTFVSSYSNISSKPLLSLLLPIKHLNETILSILSVSNDTYKLFTNNKHSSQILSYLNLFNKQIISHLNDIKLNIKQQNNPINPINNPINSKTDDLRLATINQNDIVPNYTNAILVSPNPNPISSKISTISNEIEFFDDDKDDDDDDDPNANANELLQEEEDNKTNAGSEGNVNVNVSVKISGANTNTNISNNKVSTPVITAAGNIINIPATILDNNNDDDDIEKKKIREIKRRNIDENFNFFESYYVLKQETNYRHTYSGKLGLKNISRLQLLRLTNNIVTRELMKDGSISHKIFIDILRSIFYSKLNGKRLSQIKYHRFKKILNLSQSIEISTNISFNIFQSIKKYFEKVSKYRINNYNLTSQSLDIFTKPKLIDIEHYYQGQLFVDRKFYIMNEILYPNNEYEQMFQVSDNATDDEKYDAENYANLYRITDTNLLFKKIELECFDDLQSVLNEQYGLKIFDNNSALYFGTEIDYNDDGNQIEYISSRLVMTEYKGSTLAEKIYDYAEENDYLSEYDIGLILYKILNSVQKTHRQNVIHCDLKPDNLIVSFSDDKDKDNKDNKDNDDDNNQIKQSKSRKIGINLIDFGYCEILPKKQDFIIQKHLIKGTKGYISPEIYTEYKYSKKSDIYSIGCIGFEMITGGTLPNEYDINGNYIDESDDDDDDNSSDTDDDNDNDDIPKVLNLDIENILKTENRKRALDNRVSVKLMKFITKLLTYEYDGRYDIGKAVLVARKNWSTMKPVKHRTAFF